MKMFHYRFLTNYSRFGIQNNLKFNRPISANSPSTTKEPLQEALEDAPIKYSTSPASKWKACYSLTRNAEPRLWYEPYVIMVSLSAMLVYFTLLREENDIDEELSRTLYSRIEGLEEQQLKFVLRYNEERGLETQKIRERLKEIEAQRVSKGD